MSIKKHIKKERLVILINNELGIFLLNYIISNVKNNKITIITRSEGLAKKAEQFRTKVILHPDFDFETEKSFIFNYVRLLKLVVKFWFFEFNFQKVSLFTTHNKSQLRTVLASYMRLNKLFFYEDGSGSYNTDYQFINDSLFKKLKFPLIPLIKNTSFFVQFTAYG